MIASRLSVVLLVVASVASLATGCDEAQVRTSTSTQPLVFDDSGLRLLVTPRGLATLYDRAQPQGFVVAAPTREVWREEGIVIEAGPIEQTLAPDEFVAAPTEGAIETTTRFVGAELLVPLRVTRGADVRICRKALTTAAASIRASAELIEGDAGPRFAVTTTPALNDESWMIRDVGSCSQGDLPIAFDLETALVTYVRDALVVSAVDALETSPLETLGLVFEPLEVRRLSPFEPNRGAILLEARLPEDGATITAMGLTARVDTALDVERARCAPPVDVPAASGGSAAPIDAAEIAGTEADVAFALGENLITRSAQVTALSGFACRGFEDTRLGDENGERIATDQILLEELGLGDLPLGETSRVVFRPGALPELTLRPERGDLRLTWNDITLDIYAEMFGVPTRIATLETDVRATLRPGAGEPGFVAFSLETIDVSRADLSSELATAQDPSVIESWTRRTLLITLADLFTLPLPVAPGSGIEVVRTEVRSTDLLVTGRF